MYFNFCFILSHRETHAPGLSVVISCEVQERGRGERILSESPERQLGYHDRSPNKSYDQSSKCRESIAQLCSPKSTTSPLSFCICRWVACSVAASFSTSPLNWGPQSQMWTPSTASLVLSRAGY